MIYLASASPRRKELLEKHGVHFHIVSAEITEIIDTRFSPAVNAMGIAFQKTLAAKTNGIQGIILGCDTIVVVDDEILGKPKSRQEAKEMLQQLSGKTHEVVSGYALLDTDSHGVVDAVTTRVTVKTLTESDIEDMLDTGEYEGVSGSYRIQGAMGEYIEQVEGSVESVIGLPVDEIIQTLNRLENKNGENQKIFP